MFRLARAKIAGILAVLLAVSATLVAATPAQAAAGCKITYTPNEWTTSPGQGGFGANITVQNLGDPLTSWTLRFTFPGTQQISMPGWSATWAQSGANVTAANLSWNGNLGTGASTGIGFNGTWSGSNPAPTSFSLNNVACTGTPANVPPTVSLTSPTNGSSFAAPATINLAATAADADGTVQRVEFYNGSTLLSSDTTSPYSFSWASVAAGTYALTARAFDNAGATTTSATSTVTVSSSGNQPPRVTITSPTPGTVFTAPATVTVNVTATDADGTIARVDVSFGAMSATDTTAPYSVTFTNVAAGSYALSARATDNLGAVGVLDPISYTVNPPSTGGSAPALHVSGNKILTSAGATYRLLGVNRSGGEFACIQGNGIWDGPMDQASITAMRTWKIRVVRVPLNEQCWLGVAPVQSQYGGTAYQNAVKAYVNLLVSNGITPIVEMHWNYGQYTGPSAGCSDVNATCQKPMPDAQYAPSFWTGVANAFKGNDAVILDLFNEPYPERATGSATSGWTCWRDGGTCPGIGYQVAGFQSLVNSVRATGATNIIMIGGLAYSNDLTQWLTYKPSDPLNNLAAFAHVYNFNTCANTSCYDTQFGPVAAQIPLSLTEIGENDCAHGFIDTLMSWADARGVGYLGWTWNTWPCTSGPALITDYNGTPTAFGQGLKDRLATVSN
jgi:hypothetical protein